MDEKLIYQNDLYPLCRLRDPDLGASVVLRVHLPMDGVIDFTIPLTAVTSREELRKELSKRDIAVTKYDELMQYMITWLNELQATTTSQDARRQSAGLKSIRVLLLGTKSTGLTRS